MQYLRRKTFQGPPARRMRNRVVVLLEILNISPRIALKLDGKFNILMVRWNFKSTKDFWRFCMDPAIVRLLPERIGPDLYFLCSKTSCFWDTPCNQQLAGIMNRLNLQNNNSHNIQEHYISLDNRKSERGSPQRVNNSLGLNHSPTAHRHEHGGYHPWIVPNKVYHPRLIG